jgi:hypothetical protein
MSETEQQKLPCVICTAQRRVPAGVAAYGPGGTTCAACWQKAGGDLRFVASCFLDNTPPPPSVLPN